MEREGNDTRIERARTRQRTILGGLIVDPLTTTSKDCIVRDYSELGARIQLPISMIVPRDMILIIVKHQVAMFADRRWQYLDKAGVRFGWSYHLDQALPPELAYLKDIFTSAERRRRNILVSKGFHPDADAAAETLG